MYVSLALAMRYCTDIDAYLSDHITELKNQRPKQPFFFLKPPSSILLPNGGPLLAPRGVTMHYEIELGLVMGKELKDLDPEDQEGAMDAIDSPSTLSASGHFPH